MSHPSARLLRLLSHLQTARIWSGAELARRLDVDVRTVRRDIGKLRDIGYSVEAVPGRSGYRLGVGTIVPPLLLDDDETIAVALGLYMAACGPNPEDEESAMRALAKIHQVIPARLQHRFAALRDAAAVVPSDTAAVSAGTVNTLTRAIQSHQTLRFDYLCDGAVRHCITEPHRLLNIGRRWYLLAWHIESGTWHTYRVDLLTPRIPLGPRFAPRRVPVDEMTAHLSDSASVLSYKIRAPITLAVSIAEASAAIPPTAGYLEAIDADSCLLHIGANSYDEMSVRLGLAGFPFRIHNFKFTLERCPAFVAYLHELLDRSAGLGEHAPIQRVANG